jgi:hypothetical protein
MENPPAFISDLRRPEVKIGYVSLSSNSSWVQLDDCLRGLVKAGRTNILH